MLWHIEEPNVVVNMGIEDWKNTQSPTVDLGLEDGVDIDVGVYDIHKLQVQAIEERVQNPPPGTFGPSNLRWKLEYRPPRGEHKKSHIVQQCYVPTSRVQDFVEGMQCGREGAQCRFRTSKENRRPNQSREGHKTALDFTR